MKDRKGLTITNAFQKYLDKSNHKPNKIRVDKGSEFYNRSISLLLEKNGIEMYSQNTDGKSVIESIKYNKTFINTWLHF